jgi:hypothetical protein
MRLEVRVDNVRAIAFYRSLGYEDVGLTHDFYEDHSDALRMRKRLRGDRPTCWPCRTTRSRSSSPAGRPA